MTALIESALHWAAVGQFAIALLNLSLVRIMGWREDLARLPLLVRQVFHVHAWFVSITLVIFSALTWRFAHEIAAGLAPVYRWIACAIGLFWSVRAIIQVIYYSSSHWRGIRSRTIAHLVLLLVYAGWAALYLTAGLRR